MYNRVTSENELRKTYLVLPVQKHILRYLNPQKLAIFNTVLNLWTQEISQKNQGNLHKKPHGTSVFFCFESSRGRCADCRDGTWVS